MQLLTQKLISKCTRDPDTNCWIYPKVDSHGIPIFNLYMPKVDEPDFARPFRKPNAPGYQRIYVRRWIYQELKETILTRNDILIPLCDSPHCVNPEHFKAVTRKEAGVCPKPVASMKLSEESIREIFTLWSNPPYPSMMSLARIYDVSPTALYDIQAGRNWKSMWEEIQIFVSHRKEKP